MTTARADARTSPCLRKAGAINYHVYLRSAGSIHPAMRPWYDAVLETWLPPEIEDRPDSGFYSQFYRPKHPPDSPGYCPPVLAFRGSEVSDFDLSQLGVVLNFDLNFSSNVGMSGVSSTLNLIAGAMKWWNDGGTVVLTHGAGKGASAAEALAFVRQLPSSRTIAQIAGSVPISFVRPASFGAVFMPICETITVTYRLSATAHFGQRGDWATNIAQGMGEEADQYKLAADEGKKRAEEAIRDWNGKLIITGHSLGGGLAATAAISGKFNHPDCDISCVTYNAAGVHENTIKNYVNKSATLGQNPNTHNYSVRDEILNTLQLQQVKLPFVQPFIKWANAIPGNPAPMSFREGRNATSITNGISPGHMDMGTYASAGDPLPVLWPVKDNTLAAAQVKMRENPQSQAEIAEHQARRTAANDALQGQYDALWDEREALDPTAVERRAELTQQITALEQDADNLFGAIDRQYETQPLSFPDISNVGNFPTVSALEGMARGCATADQFVTGLVAYLLAGDMNPNRASGYDLSLSMIASAKGRIDQLTTEFKGIAPLGAAAGAYHVFDPCAWTFHAPN